MKRSEAADLIDQIRMALVRRDASNTAKISRIESIFEAFHVKPLRHCEGEAHDPRNGGMIDNCMVCAPRWGVAGPKIKIT